MPGSLLRPYRVAKVPVVSRGLLSNETEVKWHSVGSTVGEVTQTYS